MRDRDPSPSEIRYRAERRQTYVEAFVLFATLLAVFACAVAWGVI